MNSKRSAKRSRQSQDSQQGSEVLSWNEWRSYFTPEQIKVCEEVADDLNKAAPWLSATREEARVIAVRAWFPRSKFWDKQDVLLLRAIYCVIQRCQVAALDFHEIVDLASRWCLYPEDR